MKKDVNRRRNFLKQALALGAGAAGLPQLSRALPVAGGGPEEGNGFTFLFQGDSITDGARTRNNDWNHVMGHGYQYIISSKLWYDFPQKGFRFFNRGVSGNKLTDLQARWQKDTLDIKPDALSILIGINDVSAFVNGNRDYGVEQYESGYRLLLQQTKEALPNVELILCEPFVLKVGSKVAEKWDAYSAEVQSRQQVVKRLSGEFNAVFVPFGDAFNRALAKAPADYWIWDGVHPMPAGHELMAITWQKAVGKRLRAIR